MQKAIKSAILTPRMWMTAGVLLFVFSLLVGYHNDQVQAGRTLATKVELPTPVMLQNFSRDTNTNLLNEVHVLGEASLGHAEMRSFGEGDSAERFVLLPVYPVSAGGLARAEAHIGGAVGDASLHRPVGRPAATGETTPVAVFVYDVTESAGGLRSFGDFGMTSLGRGFDGDVVVAKGAVLDRSFWDAALGKDAFGSALRDLLGPDHAPTILISPYLMTRDAMANAPVLDGVGQIQRWTGLGLILIGLASVLWGYLPRRSAPKASAKSDGARAKPHSRIVFQPLASQDEIRDSDNANVRPNPYVAALGDVTGGFAKAAGRFRNRPSRLGD